MVPELVIVVLTEDWMPEAYPLFPAVAVMAPELVMVVPPKIGVVMP